MSDRLEEVKMRGAQLIALDWVANKALRESAYADLLWLVAEVERDRNALHELGMLALQSKRYVQDRDYRDATDNALGLSHHWSMVPATPDQQEAEPNG